jgi:WD40 repeat protein
MYRLESTLNAHSNNVNAIALSPNESLFATCSSDGGLKLWELKTGKLLCTQFVPGAQSLSFSQDGKIISASLADGIHKSFKIKKGVFGSTIQLGPIDSKVGSIVCTDMVFRHQVSASISLEGYLVLKDIHSTVLETLASTPGRGLYSAFAFSQNGELLLGGLKDGGVLILKKNSSGQTFSFNPLIPRVLITNNESLGFKSEAKNLLGAGGFGNVYSGKMGDYEVAVKIANKKNLFPDEEFTMIKLETDIHSLLNHPNIAQFYGVAPKVDPKVRTRSVSI